MTIKDLKMTIADLPDDMIVVTSAPDHELCEVDARPSTGLYDRATKTWTEDHGEKQTPEAQWGKRLKVLIIT